MENLVIKYSPKKKDHPEVVLDIEEGTGFITGESFMDGADAFYSRIFEWLVEFFKKQEDIPFELNFKLTYFNTSSSRALLELFTSLRKLQDQGYDLIVNWHYYEPEDDGMLLEGEDLAEDSELELNFIPYYESIEDDDVDSEWW